MLLFPLLGPWQAASAGLRIYFPGVLINRGCPPASSAPYHTLPPIPPPTDRPAEHHADLNLALRGYDGTSAYLGLVDYGGEVDRRAPQLRYLFADQREARFQSVYRVYNWDWSCNCRNGIIRTPAVTLVGLAAQAGETIHVPRSGYDIGQGFQVLVLYASETRLTLKYTGEDNVVWGYTVHLENVCVDPNLLALYRAMDAAGRRRLPALRAGEAVGRARDGELRVAIRDHGTFLDPRSRKDWWQ